MKCSQMGGPCEGEVQGETPDEMMQNGWKHLEEAHPEMVATLTSMSEEETEAWTKQFLVDWEQTPSQ